jgi:8-oxo-dGTP diphosphatase
MDNLPHTYYRVSAKALILDETKTKFLITLEDSGFWELPGGGLDWGESIEESIKREIKEEMGLEVLEVGREPLYFLRGQNLKGNWSINLLFEVKVKNLNFTPSEECREIKFVDGENLKSLNTFRTVQELGKLFDPNKHR